MVLMLAALLAASLDGKKIHYTNHGSGTTAVVLVHGWTCDETFWQYQVPALKARHRVITIDLPGHGKSEVPLESQMTMNNFARAVNAVLEEEGVARAVLAGHSMGTPVVRQFARLYPAKTAALILVDGTIFPPREAAERQGRGLVYRGEGGMRKRLAAIRSYFGAATTPALREHIERVMTSTAEATASGAIDGMLAMDVWQDESPVKLPTLAVYAGTSGITPAYLRQLFPQLEFHKLAGTGHFLMMEKPARVNQLMLAFLAKTAAKAAGSPGR
jgi:pimeloyl-ACP methyl ester carboxylesterase